MPPERLHYVRPARWLAAALLACSLQATAQDASQAPPAEQAAPWYRVEIIVFRQPGTSGLAAEAWQAEPALDYPARYRHLVDRRRADARLAAFPGSRSAIDNLGRQILSLPAPRSIVPLSLDTLDVVPLPWDAEEDAAPQLEPEREDGIVAVDTVPDATSPEEPAIEPERDDALLAEQADDLAALPGPTPIDPPRGDSLLDLQAADTPLPAPAPFTLLSEPLRDLNRDAARMRSAGYEVLMHSAWVQPVTSEDEARAIVLDHSGDADRADWPRLQGSIRIHLSRYLHVNTLLWLNTDGTYLHPDWRMPDPPRAPEGLVLNIPELETWYRQRADRLLDALDVSRPDGIIAADLSPPKSDAADRPEPGNGLQTHEEVKEAPSDFPWRHAIVLEQSRRMRGGELHYLDHPVMGMLIKMSLLEDDDWLRAYRDTKDWEWEDRHNVIIDARGEFTRLRRPRL